MVTNGTKGVLISTFRIDEYTLPSRRIIQLQNTYYRDIKLGACAVILLAACRAGALMWNISEDLSGKPTIGSYFTFVQNLKNGNELY